MTMAKKHSPVTIASTQLSPLEQVVVENGLSLSQVTPAATAPVVESKPRTVELVFALKAQSPAFFEITKPDGNVGWLRKSAMKSAEVNEAEGLVMVTMDRKLASRRGFLKTAA